MPDLKPEGAKITHIDKQLMNTAGMSEDDMYLAKLGYKSELYRGFNAFMSFSFCFTSVGVICSNALIFPYGIEKGGPVMLTIGWIVGCFFTLLIALSLAEITSTYPVSGSVF
jgi:amino acid transporter